MRTAPSIYIYNLEHNPQEEEALGPELYEKIARLIRAGTPKEEIQTVIGPVGMRALEKYFKTRRETS